MEVSSVLLASNLAATLYMVGLIWFVQLVHYPLLAEVGEDQFVSFEQAHMARTWPVVGPPMLVELATTLLLTVAAPSAVPTAASWLGVALLTVVWLSTGLLQVPSHRRLGDGFDARVHRRLVTTNWIRTAAWTARGLLVMWMQLVASAAA
jgi:hypothetical protein